MSEDGSGTTETTILPAYEVYREAGQPIGFSPDAKRLKWALEGPLSSAIEVMHGMKYDAHIPTEPYGDQTAASIIWHPISRSPFTEPKVSSVTVHIDNVEDWEYQWLEFHRFCHHPDESGEDPDEFLFGDLPDYDPDSDEEDEVHLLRCCRADRPRKKGETLLVKASGAFLTIHDYLSVVHPWLLGRREDILGAEGNLMKNEPLPTDTKLMISHWLPDQINFETEEDWRESMSKEPPKGEFTKTLSVFERPTDWSFMDGAFKPTPL
ncbi:hypothetical protein IQ07DRAFT_274295 [Pyrenochaeta sp. DS3sAY3a]|nr:hypothetical protein IQ07DRAFT_274295 [Pyrenochaeta sp. DS3sAY3a]